jgi:prefoldin alpha subunit
MTKERNKEDEAKEVYLALQTADRKINAMQQQIERVEEQISQINDIKHSLDQIAHANGGEESYVPLANGIFVRAKLEKVDDVLINVGASVCVKKSIAEAKELMDKQLKDILMFRSELMQRLENTYKEAQELEKKAREITNV